MSKYFLLLIISLSILNASCTILYGIKQRPFDDKSIAEFVKEFDADESLILKDSLYSIYYYAIDSCSDSTLVKNLFQPLQVHYLDANFQHLATHINCYASPGLTKLNWSAKGKLANFPPLSDVDAKSCTQGLEHLLSPYPLKNEEQYYVVIFWNLYMKKQSKHLIKTVEKYIQNKACKLVLVNNDIWYAETED